MKTADSTARKQNYPSSTELARSGCCTFTKSICESSIMAIFMTDVADHHYSVFSTSAPDVTTDAQAKEDEAIE